MTARAPGSVTGLPRSAVVLLSIGGAVLGASALRISSGTVAPMLLALVLAIAVLPISNGARRRGWPTWLATTAALVTAYVILLVLVLGSALCLLKLAEVLPHYSSKSTDLVNSLEATLGSWGLKGGSHGSLLQLAPNKVVPLVEGLLSSVASALGHFTLLVTAVGVLPMTMHVERCTLEKSGSDLGAERFLMNSETFGIPSPWRTLGALPPTTCAGQPAHDTAIRSTCRTTRRSPGWPRQTHHPGHDRGSESLCLCHVHSEGEPSSPRPQARTRSARLGRSLVGHPARTTPQGPRGAKASDARVLAAVRHYGGRTRAGRERRWAQGIAGDLVIRL